MDTIERLYAPISERASRDAAIDNAIASRPAAAGSLFSWGVHLLPVQRREAMYALYAFYREVDDIADGEASRSLKQTLLFDWRSEIVHLYGGRPRNAVTRGPALAVMHSIVSVTLHEQTAASPRRDSMQLTVVTKRVGRWRAAALMNARRLTMERQLFLDDVDSLPADAQRQVVSDLVIMRKLYCFHAKSPSALNDRIRA